MVRGGHFRSKTVVGHGIGHKDATLSVGCVGCVVCIEYRDVGKANRNANYLSVVHACTVATPLPGATEMASVINVCCCDGVAQA